MGLAGEGTGERLRRYATSMGRDGKKAPEVCDQRGEGQEKGSRCMRLAGGGTGERLPRCATSGGRDRRKAAEVCD